MVATKRQQQNGAGEDGKSRSFHLTILPQANARDQTQPPWFGDEALGQGWAAKIVEAARPDTITLVRTKTRQQYPMIEKSQTSETTPPNQTWMVLVVELQSEPKTLLKVSEVKLVDESSKTYAPFGVGVHDKPWKFDVVKDFPEGLVSTGEGLMWLKA